MKTYRITVERKDNTWGQLELQGNDMSHALRVAARSYDLDTAKTVTLVEVEA